MADTSQGPYCDRVPFSYSIVTPQALCEYVPNEPKNGNKRKTLVMKKKLRQTT